MLIKALSTFEVEGVVPTTVEIEKDDFADLPLPAALAAIAQGAAREAKIEEARAAHEAKKSPAGKKPDGRQKNEPSTKEE